MTTLDEYTTAVKSRKDREPVVNMGKVVALNLLPPAHAKQSASSPPPPRDHMRDLQKMVGLGGVKKAILGIENQMRFFRQRETLLLPVTRFSQHFVFTGNPGSGKTSVARILGGILRDAGALQSGHVVECSARDLIGEYIGCTAPKVMARVKEAQGGVLFIDEAYALMHATGAKGSFSDEAITALLTAMENYRDSFTVVAAGYPQEMRKFVDFNPGLKSRFNRFIAFDDYDAAELEAIFVMMAHDLFYQLDPGARTSLKWVMERGLMVFSHNFPNGRFVRNLFEATVRHMANRLETRLDHGADLTRSDMTIIMGGDVDAAWDEMLHMPH
ncbi:MAG: AAA family ATPase [Alphaproteobacteria bacterium]